MSPEKFARVWGPVIVAAIIWLVLVSTFFDGTRAARQEESARMRQEMARVRMEKWALESENNRVRQYRQQSEEARRQAAALRARQALEAQSYRSPTSPQPQPQGYGTFGAYR